MVLKMKMRVLLCQSLTNFSILQRTHYRILEALHVLVNTHKFYGDRIQKAPWIFIMRNKNEKSGNIYNTDLRIDNSNCCIHGQDT